MKKLIKGFFWVIYYLICYYLPSDTNILFGKISRFIRRFACSFIFDYCGKNVRIGRKAKISTRITILDNSSIGERSIINGGVSIGANVMMGPECYIFTVNHRTDRLDIPMNQQGNKPTERVIISDDVWIGARVIILPGVTIGKGSIIGAGSVISKNVEEYSVMVGNPAVKVKSRITVNQ